MANITQLLQSPLYGTSDAATCVQYYHIIIHTTVKVGALLFFIFINTFGLNFCGNAFNKNILSKYLRARHMRCTTADTPVQNVKSLKTKIQND